MRNEWFFEYSSRFVVHARLFSLFSLILCSQERAPVGWRGPFYLFFELFKHSRLFLISNRAPSRPPLSRMDVEALLMEDDDDVLEDIDMSQDPEMSQDLVDFEDMAEVPETKSRADKIRDGGVPTGFGVSVGAVAADTQRDPGQAHQDPSMVLSTTPQEDISIDALEAEIDKLKRRKELCDVHGFETKASSLNGDKRAREEPTPMEEEGFEEEGGGARDRGASRGTELASISGIDENNDSNNNLDSSDLEMRDQHTFVPLEPYEVKLAERICRRVDEPKKHLVRLLIKTFGAALAEGALKSTESAFAEAKKQSQNKNKTKDERKAFLIESGLCFETEEGSSKEQGNDGTKKKQLLLNKRSPGGLFIWIMKKRAPSMDFKKVMKRSAEIDKLLRKQMEAKDLESGDGRGRKRFRPNAHTGSGGFGGGRLGTGRGQGRVFEKPKSVAPRVSNTAYAEDV